MDFSKSIRAFVAALPTAKMNGQERFLAVACHCAGGKVGNEVSISSMRTSWPRSTIGAAYSPTYYSRADEAGWVSPTRQGFLTVTQEGLDHLAGFGITSTTVAAIAGLHTFDVKETHTFDKVLRGMFKSANMSVSIADPYVDETIFDNLLDLIPTTTEIRLINTKTLGTYDARVKRFATQYSKFQTKTYADLHDRFLVIDGNGYVIGPSLKDAARKSPAILVSLNTADSAKLQGFFDTLWKRST